MESKKEKGERNESCPIDQVTMERTTRQTTMNDVKEGVITSFIYHSFDCFVLLPSPSATRTCCKQREIFSVAERKTGFAVTSK